MVAEGCTENDPAGCHDLRGDVFNPNISSTWVEEGLYELPLYAEVAFGYSGNGRFGFDNLTLSYAGGGGATITNSVVAGIATKDFYVGTLGLTPYGTNFTDFNNPEPSILKLLRDSGQIASRSWAYTAGAFYTPKKTFGSLLFGGYDTSRFVPNNVTIGLGQDISRDILVGIQSIRNGNETLLDQGIVAYIDSTISHIWLPIQACQNFESAFGLTWDPEVELYLVNDTLHSTLLADNPTIYFTIGSTVDGGETVEIEMPYGAFDLEAGEPLTSNGTSRYFPLKRAENSTQYALGRTFLQQAYLIVDYDRNNFSVSQAVFPDTSVPEQRVPIVDPSQNGTDNSTSATSDDGLTAAAIAGIVVGVVVAAIIAVGVMLFYLRRRRLRRPAPIKEQIDQKKQPFEKAELDSKDPASKQSDSILQSPDGLTEPLQDAHQAELTGSTKYPKELAGGTGKHAGELLGTPVAAEAPGDKRFPREMPGSDPELPELDSDKVQRTYHELP